MSLFDPKRKDSEIRKDLSTLREEVREVMTWPIYKDVILQTTNGRAMGAMGVIVSGDSDNNPQLGWIRMQSNLNADTVWWSFVRADPHMSLLGLLTGLVLFLPIRIHV